MLKRINGLNRDLTRILGEKADESESEEEVPIKKKKIQVSRDEYKFTKTVTSPESKFDNSTRKLNIDLNQELELFEEMKEKDDANFGYTSSQKPSKKKQSESHLVNEILDNLPFDSKDLSNGSNLFQQMKKSKCSQQSKEEDSLYLFKNLEDKITSQVFNTKENNTKNSKVTSDEIINQFSQRSEKQSNDGNIIGETNDVLRALLFKHKI